MIRSIKDEIYFSMDGEFHFFFLTQRIRYIYLNVTIIEINVRRAFGLNRFEDNSKFKPKLIDLLCYSMHLRLFPVTKKHQRSNLL